MPRAAEVMSNAMNVFKIDGTEAARVATFWGAANTSPRTNSLAMGMAQDGLLRRAWLEA